MTGALSSLSETPDPLDALIEALKSLTASPAAGPRLTRGRDGCPVRRTPRRAPVRRGVLHGGLLNAVGDRVADARHARIGRHARSGMHRPVSHPRRWHV